MSKLKAAAALAAIRGDKTLAELSIQYGVPPSKINQWKRRLEERAAELFYDVEVLDSVWPEMKNVVITKGITLTVSREDEHLDTNRIFEVCRGPKSTTCKKARSCQYQVLRGTQS